MLILPIHFDANEWFVLIVLTPLILAFFFFRKVLPTAVTIAVLLYFSSIGKWVDYVLGIKYRLYLALDTYQQDLFDWLCLGVAYPLMGYFYIYFMIRWKLQGTIAAIYIVAWAIFVYASEWTSSFFKVFVYNGWRLSYSFIVYLAVLTIAFYYVKVILRYYDKFVEEKFIKS